MNAEQQSGKDPYTVIFCQFESEYKDETADDKMEYYAQDLIWDWIDPEGFIDNQHATQCQRAKEPIHQTFIEEM